MKRLLMTHQQKMALCDHFGITQGTCSEVINFKRPQNMRHAEIRQYAIDVLGAKVFLEK